MADDTAPKRDLKRGIPIAELVDGGMLAGEIDGEDALLLRRGSALHAVGAFCTHYHGPLADGVFTGETLRCPWHHACFSVRTGEALAAPALDPLPCWRVERVGDVVYAREKIAMEARRAASTKAAAPTSVVIVGGGAAGLAAAEMLRRDGYEGTVTMLSADDSPPVDRPNLSKDFLAGNAPDDWIPLRGADFYEQNRIDLRLNARVAAIDTAQRRVKLADGKDLGYGALLLATGADPVKLDVPGAQPAQIHYLRSFADSKAIVVKAASAKRAVVIGASFIGLEVAASLRARNIDVHVVGPENVPLERVLGSEVGRFVQSLHEEHGVHFHLGQTVSRVDGTRVTLSDASVIEADFIVLGVGVRPAIGLAEKAGLAIDRGIVVDAHLQTSAAGVYAAGDVARWPDPHSGERIRIEHWVVAERQGQVAAKNMLGARVPFEAVPFFWSQHYDVAINYVGHAEKWDSVVIDGALADRDCLVTYTRGGKTLAVASIGRDRASLEAELAMERAHPANS
jgi:NADPH-dependent 2,4-dienoyl-CoA reductase/sulfur reductase-like enzyme/nitrite reductase/ring-hydroxylating ferredoxin subunit